MHFAVTVSPAKNKKFRASWDGGHVDFGDNRYEDYTMHKDAARKAAYTARHRARESWGDPTTAGFWSRWLLWNKPTLAGSARDIRTRFGIGVTMRAH